MKISFVCISMKTKFHNINHARSLAFIMRFMVCRFHGGMSFHLEQNSVEPVYNGHPRDLSNWPLNTGGRLIQDH